MIVVEEAAVLESSQHQIGSHFKDSLDRAVPFASQPQGDDDLIFEVDFYGRALFGPALCTNDLKSRPAKKGPTFVLITSHAMTR